MLRQLFALFVVLLAAAASAQETMPVPVGQRQLFLDDDCIQATVGLRKSMHQPVKKAGDAQEEVELPLKMLMMGDFTQRPDPRPLEDRKPINVDKDNFSKVMAEQKLSLNFKVPDKLSEKEGEELNVNLRFRRLSDMEPEAIANQVPELKKLLDLRAALTALKGPLGNEKAFRNKIQNILGDPASRNRIVNELGLKKDGE